MDNPTKPQQSTPATQSAPQSPEAPAPTISAPSKEHMSVGAVVAVAVLVALGLITIGFFAYNAQDELTPAQQDSSQTETTDILDTTSPVDEATIDTEVEQIDQTVEDLDNGSDFNESDLSEASLGY